MILFTSSQIGEVLQRLYDSEIDIHLSSEYADGFTVGVSAHPVNKIHTIESPKSKSIINTIDAIAFAVYTQYPGSEFSKWYHSLHSKEEPYQSVSGHAVDRAN